jgi:hypothetical protein
MIPLAGFGDSIGIAVDGFRLDKLSPDRFSVDTRDIE